MMFNPIHGQREFLVACEQNSPAFTGLYHKLVQEEWNQETRSAAESGDKVGVFDGLLDTVYVLAGMANTLLVDNPHADDSFVPREMPDRPEVCWATAIHEVAVACSFNPTTDLGNVHQIIRAAEIVWSLGVKLGYPMDLGWIEVHASNMAKVDKATGKVIRRDDGKILKPEGWVGPDLAAILAGETGNYAKSVLEME